MTREEAIKLIDTHTVCFYNEIDSPTLQALHLAIEALSADAVHGEWKFVDHEIFAGEYFCNICGKLSNYCPSCGARMLREEGEK